MADLSTVAVLIPAWRPEPVLASIVAELLEGRIGQIILVDDGNMGDAASMLNAAGSDSRVSVVTHAVNLGKGRALKSGVNHLLSTQPGMIGVVTADADGQHTVKDILSVARALQANPGSVVLGSRSFSSAVPLRSRFGNTLTCKVFGFVTGVKLVDTQTGLRGLPRKVLPELLSLEGERYDYEMTMLAHVCRGSSRPIEVPIDTIYIDNNRSSHFDPVRDSMRIYFVLLRFYFSSLLAAGLDFAGFSIMFLLTRNVALSVGVGRLSSLVNFALNRRFVFHNRAGLGGALWRYYLLVVALGGASYLLISLLTRRLGWNVFAAKVSADVFLSVISFTAQRTFVFRRGEDPR